MRIRSPRRTLLRAGVLGAAVLLVIGIGGATSPVLAANPGGSGDDSGVPTDQPLPPYTIFNPPLAPALVNGVATTVTQGTHDHAGFIIEVPPNWNGDLVMWAHGFRGGGFELRVTPPDFNLRQKFLNEGFAWAASSYAGNGYDIRTGVLTTKDLADLFATTNSRPHRTYIAGVSMGGHIIGRSLEQYPGFYAGALPMCGVLGDQELFDYFLDFNLVAQDLAGVSAYPIPTNYLTAFVPQMKSTLGTGSISVFSPQPTNALGQQWRDIMINRSGGARPGSAPAFAFWQNFLFSLSTPAVPPSPDDTTAMRPGQIATNLTTRYEPNSPVDVNKTILRVRPENVVQRVLPFLTQVPKIQGRPLVPVVTLHGLGDLFVPFANEEQYAQDAAKNHQSDLVVQRAIRTINHCEFAPSEAGAAWDDLVNWVVNHQRPAGDDVLDPATVADPNFGCRFTDPAAYNNPPPVPNPSTRKLFPACPAA